MKPYVQPSDPGTTNNCTKCSVSPTHRPTPDETINDDEEEDDTAFAAEPAEPAEDLGTVPRKVTVKPGTKEEIIFAQPRKDELNGLLRNGTFKPIERSQVPSGSRVFNARFVDNMKRAGEGLRKKSRFVSQSYSDEEATTIPTKETTGQRLSQRTTLSIASSDDALDAILRDIIQAYIQAVSTLTRRVFILAPKEMGIPDGYVLEVIKPLYGIP